MHYIFSFYTCCHSNMCDTCLSSTLTFHQCWNIKFKRTSRNFKKSENHSIENISIILQLWDIANIIARFGLCTPGKYEAWIFHVDTPASLPLGFGGEAKLHVLNLLLNYNSAYATGASWWPLSLSISTPYFFIPYEFISHSYIGTKHCSVSALAPGKEGRYL